ncbi:tRNA (adenosine(37)-N6)-dimethylallyltransferase MiaA [candidate division KSB1 bacterium]|nr:tRNA (adenosine(37)-N6)-dimethylallyltransferase MiaA [candidate division KSB1 bacterium]
MAALPWSPSPSMNWTSDLKENRVIILVGATAVGKTQISLELARKMNAEIVSADSRQVYRYMDIGTAKPAAEERGQVPHHFIDIRNPDEYYSAGEYGRAARRRVAEIFEREKQPLVVGGSGFYIQALVDGLFAPQISVPEIKEKWHRRVEKEGKDKIFALLEKIDPKSAQRLHPNDVQRVVRALEVHELTNVPLSAFQPGREEAADFDTVFFGLTRKRDRLYQRIEARVDAMIEAGLFLEVRSLMEKGYDERYNALQTVGYREVFPCLRGEISRQDSIAAIKTNSRRYAKRQMVWFRRDKRIHWLDADMLSSAELIKAVLKSL